MTPFSAYLAGLVPVLGWTLAHFLWQGALIAMALQPALRLSRTPRARYAWALGALGLMAIAPVVTFAWIAGGVRIVWLDVSPTPAGVAASWERIAVDGWLIGVAALTLRTAGGLVAVERLRRSARALPSVWAERCAALQARLAGPLEVAFAQSQRVATPVLAGWLKPMVLIPAAALARLPVAELEALILHELAHARRLDAFANLAQAVVETLLFYHPAVWWVSARIRAEREQCCDDLAVGALGDPALYVRALTAMDLLRGEPALALAAGGGDLKRRAARILGAETPRTEAPLSRTAAVLLLLALSVGAAGHGASVQARPTRPASTPSTAAPSARADGPVIVLAKAAPSARAPIPPSGGAGADGPHASRQLWNDPTMFARVAALGPLPPDSDPAAQAAWRIARYDLALETDRARTEISRRSIASMRDNYTRVVARDPGDSSRLPLLNAIDLNTRRADMIELHSEVVTMARAAVAHAEAVRRLAAQGRAAAGDLNAANAAAAKAVRLVDTTELAQADVLTLGNEGTDRLANEIARTHPDFPHGGTAGPAPQLEALLAVRQRARLEAVAYLAVRDAVDAGQRPASDLAAAAESLRAAQAAAYDLRDGQRAKYTRGLTCIEARVGPDGRPAATGETKTGEDCLSPLPPRPSLPELPPRDALDPLLAAEGPPLPWGVAIRPGRMIIGASLAAPAGDLANPPAFLPPPPDLPPLQPAASSR